MAERNSSFQGSYRGAKGLKYQATKVNDEVHVDAVDNEGNYSSGRFELDPTTKSWEVSEGSLDIDPAHEGPEMDVRRNMRRVVNGRF
jgi:hypothetical protein